MSSLNISIEFITGRCVAAAVSDRDKPEWPPHPGRLFMALSAACFEIGENDEQVAALQWLACLPAPDILTSDYQARSTVKFYVPVNDKLTVNKSILQSTPGLTRSKQERSYASLCSLPFVDSIAIFSSPNCSIWSALHAILRRSNSPSAETRTRICESRDAGCQRNRDDRLSSSFASFNSAHARTSDDE